MSWTRLQHKKNSAYGQLPPPPPPPPTTTTAQQSSQPKPHKKSRYSLRSGSSTLTKPPTVGDYSDGYDASSNHISFDGYNDDGGSFSAGGPAGNEREVSKKSTSSHRVLRSQRERRKPDRFSDSDSAVERPRNHKKSVPRSNNVQVSGMALRSASERHSPQRLSDNESDEKPKAAPRSLIAGRLRSPSERKAPSRFSESIESLSSSYHSSSRFRAFDGGNSGGVSEEEEESEAVGRRAVRQQQQQQQQMSIPNRRTSTRLIRPPSRFDTDEFTVGVRRSSQETRKRSPSPPKGNYDLRRKK